MSLACLIAMLLMSGEQRWRCFLFWLQSIRIAVSAKNNNLSLPSICWCDVGCKPSDSQTVYHKQYIQERLCAHFPCCGVRFATLAELCYQGNIRSLKKRTENEQNFVKSDAVKSSGDMQDGRLAKMSNLEHLIPQSEQKLGCKAPNNAVTDGQT